MKILIIDEHPVVRSGIRQLFAHEAVTVIEAGNVAAALDRASTELPDIYILEVELDRDDGFHALCRIREYDRTARVLVLTAHTGAALASRALRAGAFGYVTKRAGIEEVRKAVGHVMNGERYLEPSMAAKVSIYCTSTESKLNSLSTRERDVLRLIAEGRRIQQIADELGVAYKTVSNVSTRIKGKLSLRRTSDLVRFYLQLVGDPVRRTSAQHSDAG